MENTKIFQDNQTAQRAKLFLTSVVIILGYIMAHIYPFQVHGTTITYFCICCDLAIPMAIRTFEGDYHPPPSTIVNHFKWTVFMTRQRNEHTIERVWCGMLACVYFNHIFIECNEL